MRLQSEDKSRGAPGRGEDRLALSAAAFLDGVGEKLCDRADRRFPCLRVKNPTTAIYALCAIIKGSDKQTT